ncbi:hypothetical protein KIP69_12215 [Geobacter sulfurreducens]|uniref:Membrane protein, putative n=1 Tax=Geobacter sulfurreducens (strain ATCC 51573 / DSM 12127 / PCA) TaxID=243231 RepID=Q74A64_GEOSL|nr:hypothetical protein [Geobacter sulfurreducens]AAR35899.1 membrane protein, putative [Geobacter sulfurreducens PCA]ADI85283.1 membrane protein, putative [Geobacter sulfurreducens KN400]AJY68758.1 membrane protein [Geobacter sulfurreducens]QVW34352.1 hypothetical protein KIP69_12215 [Geobacter sulfurreducens]UAC03223.1 hypothetical protein KVP06_12680 [Geobacter sulfurreducens]
MEFLHNVTIVTIVEVFFWLIAAIISIYFSIGNARLWTSIAIGFCLIFFSQVYALNPFSMYHHLAAIHYVISTIAIIVLTFGFREYYLFTRTLEITGSKRTVAILTVGAIALSALLIYTNPPPSDYVLRQIRMIDNANWVFLSIVNFDMILKIYRQIKDSPISGGFIAFGVAFVCLFLWKGSALYLQVYQWDPEWVDLIEFLGGASNAADFPGRIAFSMSVHQAMSLVSAMTVGGSFIYLWRLMR